MRFTKMILPALVPILLSLTAIGCSDDSPTAMPIDMGDGSSVLLRVAHLSADAPNVDVWFDGTVVLSGVPYQAVSDYLEVPEGSHRIQVTPAGASTPVVIDAEVDLVRNTTYTVAATGLLSNGTLSPRILVDNNSNSGAQARVRFVHTAADAPAVDVALAGGGAVVFGNISYRQASSYAELAAGTYDLEVRVAGTSTVVLPLPGIALNNATTYTVFAIGLVGNGSLGALPVVDAN